jgi:hypothetical protein
MTARERRLVRLAELSAMAPNDAARLLAEVTAELRSMVHNGRLREADRVLAAMLPSTARIIALAALGDLDRPSHAGDTGPLSELLARHERAYREALERDLERDGEARRKASEIASEVEQKRQNISRDRDFIARLSARRNRGHN